MTANPLALSSFYDRADLVVSASSFHKTLNLLRSFFLGKNYIETHTQSRLSILAACEDPKTIQTFHYKGQDWPLPQTGQMWLEYELLTKPDVAGYICLSTSYRNEPNPIPGRHKTIFPMFEFESHGNFEDLKKMERELIAFLGIQDIDKIPEKKYLDMAKKYGTNIIENEHEAQMLKEYGPVIFLTNFPLYTSPFWNMQMVGDIANKIDVIIEGQETIGSAERSTDPEDMYEKFHTISNGEYAKLLYAKFGEERIKYELDSFLNLKFFPRFGGGIGMTRLIRALEIHNII
jgi:aspartyl/asparaginyl-tRNA synthetase